MSTRTAPWTGSDRRRREGQALVEFAMVAPILFLMLFSVIQLGLLFGAQNGFVNGVRETARRASTYRVNEATFVDGSLTASICDTIATELANRLSASMPGYDGATRLSRTIRYRWIANPDAVPTSYVPTYFLSIEIDATYDHPLYVPLVDWFFDGLDATPGDHSLTMTASEEMRIENPPQAPPGKTEEVCP